MCDQLVIYKHTCIHVWYYFFFDFIQKVFDAKITSCMCTVEMYKIFKSMCAIFSDDILLKTLLPIVYLFLIYCKYFLDFFLMSVICCSTCFATSSKSLMSLSTQISVDQVFGPTPLLVLIQSLSTSSQHLAGSWLHFSLIVLMTPTLYSR